jgi:hypothetical protein
MRYLLTLPLRMAKAALLVPVRDADEALGISQSHHDLPLFMQAYSDRLDALEVSGGG